MAKKSGKWVAMIFWQGNKEHGAWRTRPALSFTYDMKTFFWNGGPQKWTFGDARDVKILKEYGCVDHDLEKLRRKFLRDFPYSKSDPVESAGWISPSGDFYPCAGWEHDAAAENISANCYSAAYFKEHGYRLLEEFGWVRLYRSGIIYVKGKLTQAQIDKMWDISRVSSGEFLSNLHDELREAEND